MAVESKGVSRRALLHGAAWACAGVGGSLLPLGVQASASRGAPATGVKATVLRWLDGERLKDFSPLCPGWVAASPATLMQSCPWRLNDLVDAAPLRNASAPRQVELRLIGYDGVAPVPDHALEVLFPADGSPVPVPYRIAQVRGHQLQGASQRQRTWAWDSRVPLLLHSGRGKDIGSQMVELPAEHGVYLILLAEPSRWVDPAALAYTPAQAVYHRRLVDVQGQPLRDAGYFVVSLAMLS